MRPFFILHCLIHSLALAEIVYVYETVTECNCAPTNTACGPKPKYSGVDLPLESTVASFKASNSTVKSNTKNTGVISGVGSSSRVQKITSPTNTYVSSSFNGNRQISVNYSSSIEPRSSQLDYSKAAQSSGFFGYNSTISVISGASATAYSSFGASVSDMPYFSSILANSSSKSPLKRPNITTESSFQPTAAVSSNISSSNSRFGLSTISLISLPVGSSLPASSLVSVGNANAVVSTSTSANSSLAIGASNDRYNSSSTKKTMVPSSESILWKLSTPAAVSATVTLKHSDSPSSSTQEHSSIHGIGSNSVETKSRTEKSELSSPTSTNVPALSSVGTGSRKTSTVNKTKTQTSTSCSVATYSTTAEASSSQAIPVFSSVSSFTDIAYSQTNLLSSSSLPQISSTQTSFTDSTTSTTDVSTVPASTESSSYATTSSTDVSTVPTSTESSSYATTSSSDVSSEPTSIVSLHTQSTYISTTSSDIQPTTTTEVSALSSTAVIASSTSSTTEPTQTLDGYQSDIVDYHNKVRKIHQAVPMVWNQTIADYATDYLNERVTDTQCLFEHSGGPYGENLALGYSTNDDAMYAWYHENIYYNYAAGQFGENTGHFTQMVWNASTSVGCANKSCTDGRSYLVCEYWPRGNYIGRFQENVFPAISS